MSAVALDWTCIKRGGVSTAMLQIHAWQLLVKCLLSCRCGIKCSANAVQPANTVYLFRCGSLPTALPVSEVMLPVTIRRPLGAGAQGKANSCAAPAATGRIAGRASKTPTTANVMRQLMDGLPAGASLDF